MRNIESIESLSVTGTKTIALGASVTGWGWLTSNEFLGLVGALVAIVGLAISWYYKREAKRLKAEALAADNALRMRDDARREREHQMRMTLMERHGIPINHDTQPTPFGELLEDDEENV